MLHRSMPLTMGQGVRLRRPDKPIGPLLEPATRRPGLMYGSFVAVGLIVGALLLLQWTAIDYDPWCWVTWGRELIHGNLQFKGGPSWKPLPVLFTSVFALFGSIAPSLWLVLSRAGLVVTVLMIFRLCSRVVWHVGSSLTGGSGQQASRLTAVAAAVAAGVIGTIGYLLGREIGLFELMGNSEALATAAGLIGLERAIDGHPRQAFALGALVALDRPEFAVIWIPYGLWLMWREPETWWLVIGLPILVIALWLLPEQIFGSGTFGQSLSRAELRRTVVQRQSFPALFDLQHIIWPLVPQRARFIALLPLVSIPPWLIWARRRRGASDGVSRLERGLIAWAIIAALGVGWWLLMALETEIGFAGDIRFLMIGTAFVYAASGIGYGMIVVLVVHLIRLPGQIPHRASAALGVIAAAASVAIFLYTPVPLTSISPKPKGIAGFLNYRTHLQDGIKNVIARAGGTAHVRDCGRIVAGFFIVPPVAWYLDLPFSRVHIDPGAARARNLPTPARDGRTINVVFQDSWLAHAKPVPNDGTLTRWQQLLGSTYSVYNSPMDSARGTPMVSLHVSCAQGTPTA